MAIVFTGDINLTDTIRDFGFGIGSKIKNGYNPFQNIQKTGSDIWIGNFEGVMSTTSVKSGIFKRMMRTEPGHFTNGLIDYFAIANNHVMEHGESAYKEMVENLGNISKGVFGSNSQKSIVFNHEDKLIGISAFCFRIESHVSSPSYWHNPSDGDIATELQRINNCDIKIAYIHWGTEYVTFPSTEQKRLGHRLIDQGFDLIIGMHPHVLQGYEIYKGKYIFYSLGNFLFNYPWLPGKYGAIVSLDLANDKVTPHYIHINDNLHPTIVEEGQVPKQLQFPHLNTLISNDYDPEKYALKHFSALKQYRRANRKYIAQNLFRHKLSDILRLTQDFFKRKLK